MSVDLESFAIESCTGVPVKFAGDASSDYNGDYTSDLQYQLLTSSQYFYYTNGNGEFSGNIYDSSSIETDRLIVENGVLKTGDNRLRYIYLLIKHDDN